MKKHFSVRYIACGAILIALNIVITRLLSIDIGAVRIGFSFLPIAFGSMLFGPATGAAFALIADVLGMLMSGGLPWLGFCFNTVLHGVTYGIFLFNKPKNYKNILLCVILQAVIIDTLLGSIWFNHYIGTPLVAALWTRGLDALIMIPVKVFIIKYMWTYVGIRIENMIR